ncbi:phosphoribosylaminoimidazole-succinocarboxamide synthase [Diplogelasinospora grovesii]|uniref:Phosphoribosylaminoimidazole-succinocarboxamide synthase n=1 Tax=Diplogelasinospora grovesii TaxID=303347 RepID=A0AAN6N2W1_9PEZI|nr:phosphoribosylaminoimidazole-succinocarboxamide synthase [Diplogelasinospora grovesii]
MAEATQGSGPSLPETPQEDQSVPERKGEVALPGIAAGIQISEPDVIDREDPRDDRSNASVRAGSNPRPDEQNGVRHDATGSTQPNEIADKATDTDLPDKEDGVQDADEASRNVLQDTKPEVLHIRIQSNYYALRFGPSIVGTITTIWSQAITQSYHMLIPYVVMSNTRLAAPADNHREAVIGGITFNTHETSQLLIVDFVTLLVLNLVPLKTSFIEITLDSAGWGVKVVPIIGMLIIAIYVALFGATLAALLRLYGKATGLKRNPCSLAAQIALLRFSNVRGPCEGLEFDDRNMIQRRTRDWTKRYGVLRLGYWRDKRRPEQLFHCIRFLKTSQDPEPRAESSLKLCQLDGDIYKRREAPVAYLNESETSSVYRRRPLTHHRYSSSTPDFLNDLLIRPLCAVLFAGMITLAVKLISGSILRPQYSEVVYNSFVRALLFSFLPALPLGFANGVFLLSDRYHRMLQPIRGMDKPAPARDNVLVDYISPDPITTLFTALSRGHYRIAWGTFLALICSVGPIIGGSMFTFDLDAQTFQASPLPTFAVLGITCVYIVALPFARPEPKYAAGRGLWDIVDTLSLCYDSPILRCPEFTAQRKSDNEYIYLQCQLIAQRREYQFGYYLGDSGRRRLGFSVAKLRGVPQRPDSETGGPTRDREDEDGESVEVVNAVDRVKSRFGFLRFNLLWFSGPRILVGGPLRRVDTEMGSGDDSQGDHSGQKGGQVNTTTTEAEEPETHEMAALNLSSAGHEDEAESSQT